MPSPQRELAEFLATLFTAEEWYRWLRTEYFEVSEQVSRRSAAELFDESVDCLIRFGHLDEDFFVKLVMLRPKRQRTIRSVQADWPKPDASQLSLSMRVRQRLQQRVPTRWRAVGVVLASMLVQGVTVFLTVRWTSNRSESSLAPARATLEACQTSFLNLEDDLRDAATFDDLRMVLREHIVECRPLMQHLATSL